MNTLNRQIRTDHNAQADSSIELEVVRAGVYQGKKLETGEVVTVSKSEARRILTIHKGLFKIKIATL